MIIKDFIELTEVQRSVIVGCLLGDATCRGHSPTSNRTIIFAQASKEHLFFIYSFFANFCKEPYYVKPSPKSVYRPGFENSKGMWTFYTPTNVAFNPFYEEFYGPIAPRGPRRTKEQVNELKAYLVEMKAKGINRTEALGYNYVKHVPINIEQRLNDISLAHWIMGDGSWKGYGVSLATHSFTLEDTNRLVDVLNSKFGITCTIQKDKGGLSKKIHNPIYVNAESVENLRKLVVPHMPKFMWYKLGLLFIGKPYAMKVARTVWEGGKLVKAYLSSETL